MSDFPLPENWPLEAEPRLRLMLRCFEAGRMGDVLALGRLMAQSGQLHPLQTMMFAAAAEFLQKTDQFALALTYVDRLLAHSAGNAAHMLQFEHLIMTAEIRNWLLTGAYDRVLYHLALVRRIDPVINHIFPADAFSQAAKPVLPDQTPHHPRGIWASASPKAQNGRAVFFMRRHYFGVTSRPHDMGPRFAAALDAAGWPCLLIDPSFDGEIPQAPSPEAMLAHIDSHAADLVLIDHFGFNMTLDQWERFSNDVRRTRPGVKLVHIGFDPWLASGWPQLAIFGRQVDLIWSHTPDGAYWDELGLRDKLFYFPFPVGVPLEQLPHRTANAAIAFYGAVESYNLSRAYWLSGLKKARIAIDQHVTNHRDDRLNPLESYRNYLGRFCQSNRLLSFSLRTDGSRMLVGRSFETVFSGGLLLQERVDHLDFYLTPGDHYFRFETFSDLVDLICFLDENPKIAQETAARGQSHYLTNFNDGILIRQLVGKLFG
jgi:hypothetical protein